MFKTVIDNIVPDYIKIILQRCDEELLLDPFGQEMSKITKCSKYQWQELLKKIKITQWEECLILLKTSPEQRQEILSIKEQMKKAKKHFLKIVKNLL